MAYVANEITKITLLPRHLCHASVIFMALFLMVEVPGWHQSSGIRPRKWEDFLWRRNIVVTNFTCYRKSGAVNISVFC